MSRERLLMIASLVVVIAGALWWTLRGEYEDRPVFRPAEVRLVTEKYFIAGQWLSQDGHWTGTLNRLDELFAWSATNQFLILHGALGEHNELEQRRLEEWVMNGGTLLVEAPPAFRDREVGGELNPHGIRACRYCPGERDSEDEGNDKQDRKDDGKDDKEHRPISHRELRLPDGQDIVLIDRARLQADDAPRQLDFWYDQEGYPVLVRYPVGEGRVVLLASNRWFDNRSLIYPGHARLLSALVGDTPKQVFLQQRDIRGGLLAWLWQQAPLLWIVAIALLALAIWRRLPRLGPVRLAANGRHRQMREHVLATARFDWRHNQGGKLISAVREEAIAHLTRRFPDWPQLGPQMRLERLGRLCPEHERETLAWYLSLDETDQAEEFIRFVQLHRQLMQTL